jgi:6-phosphogluconolactonase
VDIRVAQGPEAAARVAADSIARRLRDATRRRGRASIAFSGGSTPALMIAALATMSVPWPQLVVFQVDERVAPDGDPTRNRLLLDALPIRRSQIVPMPVTVGDLESGARRYSSQLPDRFDVVHLGIGDDGHTASWPPDDTVVLAPGDVAVVGPFRGCLRMTLTPRAVNRARGRLVLAVGEDKADVVARWMLRDASLPIQAVRRTGTVLVLDMHAASRLHPLLPAASGG